MYGLLKKALFQLDPERAHHAALGALAASQAVGLQGMLAARPPDARLRSQAFGLRFPAPLGLAAGFDKGAQAYNALLELGFSHVEVGTVTAQAQPGNDGLRMQRLPELGALVNRLGFPGPGFAVVAHRLASRAPRGIVGANVGPNKWHGAAEIPAVIAEVAGAMAPHAAYVALNVSSPNTPGLRAMQEPAAVSRLVRSALDACTNAGTSRPILLKVHPDAADADLAAVAKAARDAGAAGLIATNTTRERPPRAEGAIEGGLSGAPLRARARQVIAMLHNAVGRDLPIVGVGGVASGTDAWGHLCAGATLLQGYTAFVYRGPRYPVLVHDELVAKLDEAGLDRLDEAIGIGDPT